WTETDAAFTVHGVCADGAGNVVVSGEAGSSAFVRKYDDTGAERWTVQLDLGMGAIASADRCDVDGLDQIVVTGSVSAANQDAFVCKLAP
ncbi:MAG: hypothetical protein KDK70_40525, partial [Myxococcales bacterium]|nr:hypothetical protein [Myxococcales bacterium]